jgi:hypothetical protein
MRNLVEYPITYEEVVEFLTELYNFYVSDGMERGAYGDMRPLLIEWAIEELARLEDLKE